MVLIWENAAMSEQLSLLEWKAPAEIIVFPFHRSHGMTVCAARAIAPLDTAKRTGRLNAIRTQIRKRLTPLVGPDHADVAADDLLRMIRIQSVYVTSLLPKQQESPAVLLSMTGQRIETAPHGYGAGKAGALGQGAKLLAGLGRAHEETEYDATRAREEGTAA